MLLRWSIAAVWWKILYNHVTVQFFPVMSHWWLEISHDKSICTTEMGKCYKSGLVFSRELVRLLSPWKMLPGSVYPFSLFQKEHICSRPEPNRTTAGSRATGQAQPRSANPQSTRRTLSLRTNADWISWFRRELVTEHYCGNGQTKHMVKCSLVH